MLSTIMRRAILTSVVAPELIEFFFHLVQREVLT